MQDNRRALARNSKLNDANYGEIVIQDEVERSVDCIVYNAIYILNRTKQLQCARIKEYYPNYLPLIREYNSNLQSSVNEDWRFEAAKKECEKEHKNIINIMNGLVLSNYKLSNTNIIDANNTKYILIPISDEMNYENYQDKTLKELILHIKKIAIIVEEYHNLGYLHLDIKPKNILIESQKVTLLNSGSFILRKEGVESVKNKLFFPDGFSAPEQVEGKVNKIDTCSDIYSIGAVFYYKLYGEKPENELCRFSSKYNFNKIKFNNKKYSLQMYSVLEQFLKMTLTISSTLRLQKMSMVIELLDKLLELVDK